MSITFEGEVNKVLDKERSFAELPLSELAEQPECRTYRALLADATSLSSSYYQLNNFIYRLARAEVDRVYNQIKFLYFPDIDREKKQIGIYKNSADLLKGRRTYMKPSKFFRFIGIINNELIKTITTVVNSHFFRKFEEIEFIEGKEIAEVYQEPESCSSLHSCMSYAPERWDFPDHVHPTHAYNSPDICLAILRDAKGELQARTIINKRRKTYIRIYGNTILKELLQSGGYKQGNLEGCRLAKVPVWGNDDSALPYLDGSATIVKLDYDDDFHIVDDEGEIDTNEDSFHSTAYVDSNGDSNRARYHCDSCHDSFEDEDFLTYIDDQRLCDSCREDQYVYAYTGPHTHYQDYVRLDYEDVYEYDGEWYTSDGLAAHDLILLDDTVYSQDDVWYDDYNDEFVSLDEDSYEYEFEGVECRTTADSLQYIRELNDNRYIIDGEYEESA